MVSPLISIVIPVYNTENYLKECINSLINQTYKNLELIFVNDGSTDKSLKILQEFAEKDNRIVIIDKKNEGAGLSRNAGTKIAKGEYLTYLDSDDYFELFAIEKFVSKISTGADLVIAPTRYKLDDLNNYMIVSNGGITLDWLPELFDKLLSFNDYHNYIFQLRGGTTSILFRTSFLTKNDLFFKKIKFAQDSELSFRIMLSKPKVYIIDDLVYIYRYLRPGNTFLSRSEEFNSNFFDYAVENGKTFKALDNETRSTVARSYAELIYGGVLHLYSKINSLESYYKMSEYFRETVFPNSGITEDNLKHSIDKHKFDIVLDLLHNLPPSQPIGMFNRLIISEDKLNKSNTEYRIKLRKLKNKYKVLDKKYQKIKNSKTYKLSKKISRILQIFRTKKVK
jgi:glycosyltransferase involved in cell wall biosynthesis